MTKKRLPDKDIPIEWIKSQATKYVISGKHSSADIPILFELISDWRKEQEENAEQHH